MGVLAELKNRGVQDLLIACMDGLTGFPDAVRAVYTNTHVQLCIVHMVRNSARFVSCKELALNQFAIVFGKERVPF
jgi:transposase-like protein